MIILISPPHVLREEAQQVNAMFDIGLDLFHFRKPDLNDQEAIRYLDTIKEKYLNLVVLHSHQHLAAQYGIERLHYNAKSRALQEEAKVGKSYIISTSTHSIQEFNTLHTDWSYALLSPLFPSISKPGYGVKERVLDQICLRKNKQVELVGLGGIKYENMELAFQEGATSVAFMGAIWNNPNPSAYFSACKRKETDWKIKER